MKNNKVILEGLDCANCANKIEIYVKKIPGLSNVSVDFVNRKLSFDYDEDVNLVSTMENIKKYIKSILSYYYHFQILRNQAQFLGICLLLTQLFGMY